MKNIHVLSTDKPSRLFKSELINSFGFQSENKIVPNNRLINQNIYITSDEEIKEGDWVVENHTFKREPYVGKCFYPKNDGTVTDEILKRDLLSVKYEGHYETLAQKHNCKKIILTTDPDLIKDGVQAIDDEFLEWFINNPTRENIDILKCPIEGLYTIDLRKEKHKQYPIGGYAPGNYYCTCASCKTMFQGDKRAVQCEPCAIEMKHKQENCEYIHEVGCIKDICTCNTGLKQETLEEAAERILFENTKNTEIKYRGGRNMVIKSMLDIAKWQSEQMYSEEDMISFVTWLSDLSFDLQHFNEKGLKPFNELFPIWFKQFKKK